HLEIVTGDLMTESARSTVHHHHDLIVPGDPQRGRCLRIEDPVVGGDLHFQVMVAGSQGAELADAALHRLIADLRRIGSRNTTLLFDSAKILVPAVSLFDAPPGSLAHDLLELPPVQPDEPFRADAGRNPPKQLRHELFQSRPYA